MTWFKSQAERVYVRRIAQTTAVYLVLTFAVTWTVHHLHPGRVAVYLLAAVPTLAVVRMLHVVALYLAEEKDEYLRRQFVQAILVGIAVTMAVNSFSDLLRSYAGGSGLPPFVLFTVLWVVTGLAQGVQSHRDRLSDSQIA
jgi:FtsH-binding integral membrane protein